jgi:hypothetical protein
MFISTSSSYATGLNNFAQIIDPTGNVGFGITPLSRLHAIGASGSTGITPNTSTILTLDHFDEEGYIQFLTDNNRESGILFGNALNASDGGIIYNTADTRDLRFRTSGNNTRMTIAGDGNVGIGVTAPVTQLHVVGGTDATLTSGSGYLQTGASTNINILMDDNEIMARNNGAAANLFLNLDGGDVRIGSGAAAFQFAISTNSAAKPTSSAWTVSSDARLKENVRPFQDGLALVQKIDPVWFTYNGRAGTPRETGVGTIAQEFQKIAPYMVREWKHEEEDGSSDGTFLAIDYGPMDFVLVNAIKELNAKVEATQEENRELRALLLQLLQERGLDATLKAEGTSR